MNKFLLGVITGVVGVYGLFLWSVRDLELDPYA